MLPASQSNGISQYALQAIESIEFDPETSPKYEYEINKAREYT